MKWAVITADVNDFFSSPESYIENPHGFHFLFSDVPYNLEAQRARFKNAKTNIQPGKDGVYTRISRGFMNQDWDTEIAHTSDFWQKMQAHLLPGAYTCCIDHSRKYDLLLHAQRETGYMVGPSYFDYGSYDVVSVPQELGWIYSNGKPAATRADLHAKDKDSWAGWHYSITPTAPKIEPITIAQVPWGKMSKTAGIEMYGTGCLNSQAGKEMTVGYRYPGNFILTHHPMCRMVGTKEIKSISGSVSGDEPSAANSGFVYNGGPGKRTSYQSKAVDGFETVPNYQCHQDCIVAQFEKDYGEKAHFFYQANWGIELAIAMQITDSLPVFYSGKVGREERELGCWDLPLAERKILNDGGLSDEPRYAPRQRHNPHPTVKPLALTSYIARMFLPPQKYRPRRAIVPFCGTGREMAGCLLAGFDEVVGIEIKSEYANCARATLSEVEKWLRRGYTTINSIIEQAYQELAAKNAGGYQLHMFE